jgi:hypothetical protein
MPRIGAPIKQVMYPSVMGTYHGISPLFPFTVVCKQCDKVGLMS